MLVSIHNMLESDACARLFDRNGCVSLQDPRIHLELLYIALGKETLMLPSNWEKWAWVTLESWKRP
jgi:hypothetical protein